MKKVLIILIAIITLMFVEYRVIMNNMKPYYAGDSMLYVEVFGHVDYYYAEPLSAME